MESIHFSSDGVVGVNLAVEEQPNGDLRIVRVYQSAARPRRPEDFLVRAEERHELLAYLHQRCDNRAQRPPSQPPAPMPVSKTVVSAPLNKPGDLAQAMEVLADSFFDCDRASGKFAEIDSTSRDFHDGFCVGVVSALTKVLDGSFAMGAVVAGAKDLQRVEILRSSVSAGLICVCAVADASDEEILAACNAAEPGPLPWSRVLRRETPGVSVRERPNPCPDHPGRMHMIVERGQAGTHQGASS